MLIAKERIHEGAVACFKLVTGEEVIAKIVFESSSEYEISKPMTVVPSQNGFGFIQTLATMNTDHTVSLSKRSVAIVSTVMEEIEKHYLQITSGIALV